MPVRRTDSSVITVDSASSAVEVRVIGTDTYRQEIVDAALFEKVAGASSEACPMHGK